MTNNQHIMIDIETFGTSVTAPIISIAAVPFNFFTDSTILNPFYIKVDIKSCQDAGCQIEIETINWWLNKSEEEQATIKNHSGIELKSALLKLQDYLNQFKQENLHVWGNSARFDLGILDYAYNLVDLKKPWDHFNELDLRTMVALCPSIKKNTDFVGTKHNPVDDCNHQIKYLKSTLSWVRSNKF